MRTSPESTPFEGRRWIRPAAAVDRAVLPRAEEEDAGLDGIADRILQETRRRVSSLAALERGLEDRIQVRVREAEAELRARMESLEEEAAATRKRAVEDAEEARIRAEREGRAGGFREGFARGRDEGYRLGVEEGRRDGVREGQRAGLEEATRRVEEELSGAVSALAEAAVKLHSERENLQREARKGVIGLAMEIAKKLIKRDVAAGDAAVRNVEKAVELIFRRGSIVIQVSPEDAPAIERALAGEPRWAEGFDAVEVRPMPDVSRGGCRLVSGAGTVDMTMETQVALIQSALEGTAEEPAAAVRGGEGGVA
jgi:flagellar assembly protein FliH